MKQEFTLESLVAFLKEAEYEVTSSGPDHLTHLAEFRKVEGGISGVLDSCEKTRAALSDRLPPPRFWATIEVDEGDLLKVTTKLMERTWEVFERGQMEFNGELRDGKTVVRIEQKDL